MKVYIVINEEIMSFALTVFKTREAALIFAKETFRRPDDYSIEEHEVIE